MQIAFYHLLQTPLNKALPQLLLKTLTNNKKALVRTLNDRRVESIDEMLWCFDNESFLPHGCRPMDASKQKVWLDWELDNKNNAEFLFVIDSAEFSLSEDFERVFYLFEGNLDNELQEARKIWKELKSKNADISYWKQTAKGWQQAN